MGQVTLFILFAITLIAGVFSYFSPQLPSVSPVKVVTFDNGPDNKGDSNTRKVQEFNVSTNSGNLQIHRQIDSLTHEKMKLQDEINDEQQALKDTNKEIADITDQMGGKNGQDILRIKALGAQIQDQQRLLVAHGQELIALNGQIDKNRQLLAEQRDMVNINTESSLEASQGHDSAQRAQDLIDEEHQKSQAQEEMVKQRIADQMQRAQDQRDR